MDQNWSVPSILDGDMSDLTHQQFHAGMVSAQVSGCDRAFLRIPSSASRHGTAGTCTVVSEVRWHTPQCRWLTWTPSI